jgi:glucan 1,3-beta-glucosidase
MRNLTFNNAVTAISHIWNWGWTYQGININNCQLGIDISTGGSDQQGVGSITLFDSSPSPTLPSPLNLPRPSLRPHTLLAASSSTMLLLTKLASSLSDLVERF